MGQLGNFILLDFTQIAPGKATEALSGGYLHLFGF
jgi:hypothetical protein